METTFEILKELNYEIKSKDPTRMGNAFIHLGSLELNGNIGLQMYAKYLEGKYHYINGNQSDSITNYGKAHLCFKKVFDIARSNRKCVNNPKFYFKYAESAYQLSKVVWCQYQKEEYESLAFSINSISIKLFPKNQSIKWLMDELT